MKNMLKKVTIKNFRSNQLTEVRLGPVTVLYGPTSSGKSTLLYSLAVLRNFVLAPGRQADSLFNLGFMDLGGFEACVFDHDMKKRVEITVDFEISGSAASYGISFSKTSCKIKQILDNLTMEAEVNLPYGLNQTFPYTYTLGKSELTVNWNGISCSVVPKIPTAETQQEAQHFGTLLNSIAETLKAIDIAPAKRGFCKPSYVPTQPSLIPTTDEEVASIIINDQHLPGRISTYAEEILGRDFRTNVTPGTATVFFQSTDKKSRIPVLLVNEGFGVNQIIYLLAKMLRVDVQAVLIEEPEVHLHPTVLRNFARALCSFAKEEEKQIILATHSELFVLAILSAVADNLLAPEEVRCYLTTKEKKLTSFGEQKVNKDGQVEGGLTSFMEAELEDIKRFLSAK